VLQQFVRVDRAQVQLQFARREDVLLADELIERLRTHPGRERRVRGSWFYRFHLAVGNEEVLFAALMRKILFASFLLLLAINLALAESGLPF